MQNVFRALRILGQPRLTLDEPWMAAIIGTYDPGYRCIGTGVSYTLRAGISTYDGAPSLRELLKT